MAIRTLKNTESLDTVWDELTYTEARLLKDPNAKDLAAPITALFKRYEKVVAGQRNAWRAEIVAQAGVDAGNDNLDETVSDINQALLSVTRQDRSSPRFRRYIKKTANEVIRMALESELDVVRSWPASLKTEPEAALNTLGGRLEKNIEEGDVAVAARRSAVAATADHRVREIIRLVDDVNAARRALYGQLITRGESKGLAPDWAGRFFQKSSAAAPKVAAGAVVEKVAAVATAATAAAGGEAVSGEAERKKSK